MGGFLYESLQNYLKNHLVQVRQVFLPFPFGVAYTLEQASEGHTEDALLQFYTREWKRYTSASTYIHHVFRYINRHWVRRELDEGHKHVYDVYTVRLVGISRSVMLSPSFASCFTVGQLLNGQLHSSVMLGLLA